MCLFWEQEIMCSNHIFPNMIIFDFLLTFFAVFYSFCIIFSKNPVHSILYLILVFLNISFLFLKYSIEFLGIFLIIIYIGAISILFLFVIMMLKLKKIDFIFNIYSILIISCFFIELIIFIPFTIIETPLISINWYTLYNTLTNTELFGILLYTSYFSFILIIGFILLVALISSVILTLPMINCYKNQKTYQQLSKNSNIIFFKNIKS